MITKNKKDQLFSVYQPLVQIKEQKIVGYEALIRHRDGTAPLEMIKAACLSNQILEFDRLCRQKALDNYKFENSSEKLLSINFNGSIINNKTIGSNNLITMVNRSNLCPENIIIEILETDIEDNDLLCSFVHYHRKYGFLIALDDVGAGNSNLNRIPMVRPDIIKIDRYLIEDYRNDFYKYEVLKSLISLSHRVGAVIIAEGIENREQAVDLTLMGVDILQGFLFLKPTKCCEINEDIIQQQIDLCALAYKNAMIVSNKEQELKNKEIDLCMDEIVRCNGDYGLILVVISHYPEIECVYYLDSDGIQVSDTICNEETLSIKNRHLFFPAQINSDHSYKEYFINASNGKTSYMTKPYISKATGRLCVTYSWSIMSDGIQTIVCVDALSDRKAMNTTYRSCLEANA